MLELGSLDLGEIAETITDERAGRRLARARRRAVQWLADNSLIHDEAAERFLASHPDPELP